MQNAQDLIDAIIAGTGGGKPLDHYTILEQNQDINNPNPNQLVIYDIRSNQADPTNGVNGQWINWGESDETVFNVTSKRSEGRGTFGPGVAIDGEDFEEVREPIYLHIQIGSEAGQHLNIELPEISSLALGVDTVDASTQEGAGRGIAVFKKAIEYVNDERSRMGAYQNRLEHTSKNLDNIVENTTAAESRIRDADMAKLMVDFSNLNILQQAGQSMLAQANQSKQGVLSLLQ